MQCISPEVIILRVALGRAVSAKTYQNAPRSTTEMSMKFRTRPSGQDSSFQLSTLAHSRGTDGTLNGSMTFSSKHEYAHEEV